MGFRSRDMRFQSSVQRENRALPGASFPCHKMLASLVGHAFDEQSCLSYPLQPETIIDFFSIIFNISFNR